MGLFDFLKSKKKKDEAAAENEPGGVTELDTSELAGIDPPETRYTQEYQDFLASQEADEGRGDAGEGCRETAGDSEEAAGDFGETAEEEADGSWDEAGME